MQNQPQTQASLHTCVTSDMLKILTIQIKEFFFNNLLRQELTLDMQFPWNSSGLVKPQAQVYGSSTPILSGQTVFKRAAFSKEITFGSIILTSSGMTQILTRGHPGNAPLAELVPGTCGRIKYTLVLHRVGFPGQLIDSRAFKENR